MALHRVDGFSAVDALAKIPTEKPDLLILDISMPRLGGIQTVKQLRRAYPTKYYPVIMLTDDSDRARVKEAAELQINAYMIKSEFSMANLLDRIEKVLEQRADQRLTR